MKAKQGNSRQGRRLALPLPVWPCVLLAALLLGGFIIEYGGGTNALPGWRQLYGWFGLAADAPEPELLRNADASVSVLDVGQGDAVLLAQGSAFALIDAGTTELAEDLVQLLQQAGVEKLELLILTHPHSDHGGGMQAILQAIPVAQLILPPYDPDTEEPLLRARIRQTAQNLGVPVAVAEAGQIWALGQGSVEILQAGFQNLGGADANTVENDASLCLRFAVNTFSFLTTGDAEAAAEQALVATYGGTLRATLLKAGHHGSATSNSEALLRAVTPQWVAISSGAGNEYGHPHTAVLDRLTELEIPAARTDTQGTLTFLWQDGELTLHAARPAA